MDNLNSTVIIVGGGPTGLLTALGLARRNIPVVVLEAAPEINHSPRALTYTPVVLDVLDKFGVLDAARAVALECGRVQWEYKDSGTVIETTVSELEGISAFPFNLHMGQDTLAQVILHELQNWPAAKVYWNATLTSFAQSVDGVTADISTPTGAMSARGAWLIGADGARSTVRDKAGIAFEGFTWPDRYIATNVSFDFHAKGYGPARFIIDPDRWALVARIDQGPLWRVTFGEAADEPEETVLERARIRLEEYTGSTDFEIVHASPYRVHERAAAAFRLGCVLLAGDAAHIVNPLGGQGLTAGIMDADMLVDTLSGVIEQRYPDAALDHYASERKRMVTQVSMAISQHSKRLVQEADPDQRRRDEAMMQEGVTDRSIMRERLKAMMAVAGEPYEASVLRAATADLNG